MREPQDRVRRFHEAMAQLGARGDVGDPRDIGAHFGDDAAELRARLIMEEAVEACIALTGSPKLTLDLFDAARDAWSMKSGARVDATYAAIAHELADLLVVTLGTAVAAGIDLSPVFAEVMAANERKCAPGARVRADGKLLKPDGWVGPDIVGALRQASEQHKRKSEESP